jgi:hypothetical protein
MAKRTTRRVMKIKGQETPTDRAARTAVRAIMDNPHYLQILSIIRSGVPNAKIAEWGVVRGVFDHNQKTVISYLQYFKKMQPKLCKPNAPNYDEDRVELDYLDRVFDGNLVVVDEETELLRLIALQKARLGIAFNNERNIGMLLHSNKREVEEMRNLLVDLAKFRGLIRTGTDVTINSYNETVKSDIQAIKQDEQQRSTIAMLAQELIS